MSKGKPLAAQLRTYHRWVATAAVVVLTWITVTGLALVVDLIFEPHLPAAPPAPVMAIEAATDAARVGLATVATDPAARPTEVMLDVSEVDGRPTVKTVTVFTGAQSNHYAVGPGGDLAAAAPPPPPNFSPYLKFRIQLHGLLEKLHRGNIIGFPGQSLSVLGGLSFLFLTVSGIWMYVDLLIKRRRIGRKALFWKA